MFVRFLADNATVITAAWLVAFLILYLTHRTEQEGQ